MIIALLNDNKPVLSFDEECSYFMGNSNFISQEIQYFHKLMNITKISVK